MPQAAAGYILQFQFNMDRSCPSPRIPDAVGLSLMCLALVPVLAAVEAIIALRGTAFARQSSESFEVPEVPEVPDIPAFFMKTPLANFTSGASWTIGFVMSIVGLQAVALLLVNKPEVETSETRIWLIIAFPSVLAARFCNKLWAFNFWRKLTIFQPPVALKMILIRIRMILCISSYNLRVDRSGFSFVHLIDWSRLEHSTIKTATYKQTLDSTCVSFSKISVCVCMCVGWKRYSVLSAFGGFQVLCHSVAQVATCPVASTLQHPHSKTNISNVSSQTRGISKKELNIPRQFPTHSANGPV